MEIHVNTSGDIVILTLSGHLDRAFIPESRRPLREAPLAADWRADLSKVTHMEAAATATLAGIANKVIRAGGTFQITKAAGQPQSQLELYNFTKLAESNSSMSPRRVSFLESAGDQAYRFRHGAGAFGMLLYDFAYWSMAAPLMGKGFKLGALLKETKRNGFDAVPVVALVSFLFGAVLSINGAYLLGQWGQNQLIADMVGVSLAREVGPVLAAIMIAARSGASISAEIGTMQVRDEVKAMWVMGMNPGKFLVTPKVLSLVLAVPALSLVADVAGMCGSFLVSTTAFNVSASTFLSRLSAAVLPGDILGGLAKSGVFGMIIGLVGCWHGFEVKGGAEEVGRATTSAVVLSIVLIIVADGFFSSMLYLLT